MKHLRIALESDEALASEESLSGLDTAIDELAGIDEGFSEEDTPSEISMESFIRMTDSTGGKVRKFKASLESVGAGVWAIVAAGAAALVALIAKALGFFTGGGSSGGGGGGAIAKATESVEATEKAAGKQKEIINKLEEVARDAGISFDEALRKDADIGYAVESLYKYYVRFFHTDPRQDAYVKFMKEISRNESTMMKRMADMGVGFEKLCRDGDAAAHSAVQNNSIDEFQSAMKVYVDADYKHLGFTTEGGASTFRELREQVLTISNDAKKGDYSGPKSLVKACMVMDNWATHDTMPEVLKKLPLAMETVKHLQKELDDVNKHLKEASDTAEATKNVPYVEGKIQHAHVSLVRDKLRDLSDAISAIMTVAKTAITLVKDIQDACHEFGKITVKAIALLEKTEGLDESAKNTLGFLRIDAKNLLSVKSA